MCRTTTTIGGGNDNNNRINEKHHTNNLGHDGRQPRLGENHYHLAVFTAVAFAAIATAAIS
jgi:hypothetical protein